MDLEKVLRGRVTYGVIGWQSTGLTLPQMKPPGSITKTAAYAIKIIALFIEHLLFARNSTNLFLMYCLIEGHSSGEMLLSPFHR